MSWQVSISVRSLQELAARAKRDGADVRIVVHSDNGEISGARVYVEADAPSSGGRYQVYADGRLTSQDRPL